MGYEIALNKAWQELEELSSSSSRCTVPLSAVIYEVRVKERMVLQKPAGVAAAEEVALLILHYLIGMLKSGYRSCGEWISFRELEGGALFYPAYQQSTMIPLMEIWKRDPHGLICHLIGPLKAKVVEGGDLAVELTVLPEILVRMIFWKGDEELDPQVSILFDRSLAGIYSTEDIAVLLLFLVRSITQMRSGALESPGSSK